MRHTTAGNSGSSGPGRNDAWADRTSKNSDLRPPYAIGHRTGNHQTVSSSQTPYGKREGIRKTNTTQSKGEEHGRNRTDHDRIHLRARREEHRRRPIQPERDHLLAQNLDRRVQHARAVQGAEHPVRADPARASTKTIPLRNIASVDTNTKFNLGSLVWGLFFLFVGFGMFDSNALAAIVCLLIAVANFANVMSATLTFRDPSGGANDITVSILEKDKLMSLAQEIQARVFTDADQLRHEESMRMAEKQYTAQANSVLIQQQMLANQPDANPSTTDSGAGAVRANPAGRVTSSEKPKREQERRN